MNPAVSALAIALLSVSCTALASEPTSITFERYDNTEEGKKFAKYTVSCSDGQSRAMTAWDGRRNWCVGEQSREDCHSRQLKAAKAACNRE